MQLSRNIALGTWILIFFNLLLAFAAIWGFLRMAPSIEQINTRNARSLEASEKMLAALASAQFDAEEFETALKTAESNITEQGESEAVAKLRGLNPLLLAGDQPSRRRAVSAIIELADSNRTAMSKAAARTRSFCIAGAWCVVFMALAVFAIGIIFEQRLRRGVAEPLEELHSVLQAQLRGDHWRRCSGSLLSGDMKDLFAKVDNLLDDLQKKSTCFSSPSKTAAPRSGTHSTDSESHA